MFATSLIRSVIPLQMLCFRYRDVTWNKRNKLNTRE